MANWPGRITARIGTPVVHLIPEIVESFPSIEAIRLVVYRPAPVLAERLAQGTEPAPDIRECAESLHDRYGIGFWDTILALAIQRGRLAEFVELAVLHDAAPDEQEVRLARDEISSHCLEGVIASAPPGHGVSLSSRVWLRDGTVQHLPMLDFRCPHTAEMLAVLKRGLRAMGQCKGVLVESPRSYHYYGWALVSHEGLTDFLARALLLAPLTDARYIAHRLIDGECRLRIGAVSGRGPAPVIKDVMDDCNH